jgi:hypothetical protein
MSSEYDNQFQLIPAEDLRRMLAEFVGTKLKLSPNKISAFDIHKECRVERTHLRHIINNTVDKKNRKLGPKLHRRLSTFMIRVQCGMIEKVDGVIIYHKEPTKPMPIVRKVALGLDGPKMMTGRQLDKPKLMPDFSDVFRVKPTIKLPKWK